MEVNEMEERIRFVLDPARKDNTYLGWESLNVWKVIVQEERETWLCIAQLEDGSQAMVTVIEPDLSEDLFMNYSVEYVE
jgi:hypothetical protein